MRVVHLIAPGRLAGAERVVLGGTRALATAGVDVQLGVLGDTRCHEHARSLRASARVPAFTITTAGRVDARALWRLRREVRRRDPDLVHVHGYKALVYARLALPRTRLVATHHGGTAHDRRARAYEALAHRLYRARAVARVVAVGGGVADALVAGGLPASRVVTIPNFVATTATLAARADGGPVRLLALGRLSPEKGLDVLLDALAGAPTALARVELAVVGAGPERERLQARAEQLGLGPRVSFAGHQADVAPWLAAADLLVLPSHREGLPMALLEAAASGLPVVASRVGAVAEIVADGVTGRLVPPGEATALGRALAEVVAGLPSFRAAASDAAPRIRDSYSAAAWARRTVELYEQLSRRPRGPR